MTNINDVRQLTSDELYEIVKKGEDKELIKLCVEEEDRRMGLFVQERIKKEAEIAKLLSEKAG